MNSTRAVERIIESLPATDGAGVKLRRSLGQHARDWARVDPFLMLDEFYSDNPEDYIAGFPPHPHRGFETVTYMLDGHMRHQDHLGNTGIIGPGGVQWMTAGSGVIHSEMPQQAKGRMRGFQLWINLPAAEKRKPPDYRDIPSDDIPELVLSAARIRLIAGCLNVDGRAIAGPINPDGRRSTDPMYLDVRIEASGDVELPVSARCNAFVYLYDGEAAIGQRPLVRRAAAVLGPGGILRINAGPAGAGLLLIAGRPIGEPVAQYGPFVMNTRAEVEQAIADYRAGRLVVGQGMAPTPGPAEARG